MRLIVEIGAGIAPESTAESFWCKNSAEYRDWFQRTPDVCYIGIEQDADALARSVAETVAHERISFELGDGRVLHFANGTVEEVVLKNVLGDPDISLSDKHELLHESARVLKLGGVLRIVEVYTPLMLDEDDIHGFLESMTAIRPFTREELIALPAWDQSSDRALRRDAGAEHNFLGNQSMVLRYRRI